MDSLPWRRACRAALLAITVVAPKAASAQDDAYARISVSITQTYDGNLFATPASGAPQEDFISRFGPVLEAGYVAVPLKLTGRYEIDAERYVRHDELNSDVARQDVGVALTYLPVPRFGLRVDASYVRTQTPSEFNVESQLAVGRARAERMVVDSAATYDWSVVTKSTVDYTFENDALAGGVASATRRLRVGVERRAGLRDTYRVDCQFLHFGFSAGPPEASYVVTGGWVHGITHRTGFEISVGPRVTEGSIRPEVSTRLNRQFRRGELSVSYSRTELTAIGAAGTFEMHRMAASGTYRPRHHLTLTGTPAFVRSAQYGREVPIYTLDVEAVAQVTRRLSLAASGRLGQQDGGFFGGPREAIPYRSLALKLMVTLPRSAPGDARRPTS